MEYQAWRIHRQFWPYRAVSRGLLSWSTCSPRPQGCHGPIFESSGSRDSVDRTRGEDGAYSRPRELAREVGNLGSILAAWRRACRQDAPQDCRKVIKTGVAQDATS